MIPPKIKEHSKDICLHEPYATLCWRLKRSFHPDPKGRRSTESARRRQVIFLEHPKEHTAHSQCSEGTWAGL